MIQGFYKLENEDLKYVYWKIDDIGNYTEEEFIAENGGFPARYNCITKDEIQWKSCFTCTAQEALESIRVNVELIQLYNKRMRSSSLK